MKKISTKLSTKKGKIADDTLLIPVKPYYKFNGGVPSEFIEQVLNLEKAKGYELVTILEEKEEYHNNKVYDIILKMST